MIRFELKAYYLIGLFFMCSQSISAQDQRVADSLEIIYNNNEVEGIQKLELLKNLSFNEKNNLQLAMLYANELIRLSKLWNNQDYLYSGYLQKGYKHKIFGNSEEALAAFLNCVEIAVQQVDIKLEGTAYMAIADVYSLIENEENSEKYYTKAIYLLRKSRDSITLASALLNAGDSYFKYKKYNEALIYYKESGQIFNEFDHEIGNAYNLGNIGMVYSEQGKDELAEQNIDLAISILERASDYYPISVYLIYKSDIYLRKNDWSKALKYAQRSLELAKEHNFKEQISDANLKLSELYELSGEQIKSFEFYKNHIVYRDSVNNIETVQKLANMQTIFEVQIKEDEIVFLEKEAEINELRAKRQKIMTYASAISSIMIFLLAISWYRRYNYIKKTSRVIQQETDKSEKLLLNILPEETALELKLNGKVQAKQFDSVSVMFTDFKDFTKYSLNLTPEVIVKSVDFYFSKFDEIIEKYGLEKIKTIGDAYMCAGGLPFPNENHSNQMLKAAFEISKFVEDSKNRKGEDLAHFDVRIGINTGPVVAGVVGVKKFAYDIWGDTVNVASRMESQSTPGRINVSVNTYKLIKDTYDCEYRGEIEVKNKGLMKMYFVNGIKT